MSFEELRITIGESITMVEVFQTGISSGGSMAASKRKAGSGGKTAPSPRTSITPTAVPVTAVPVTGQIQVRHASIAEAAYFRAERRGFAPGHELEDWLAAEDEVKRRLNGEGRAS
jgi:hypothetical protein